MTVSQHVDDFWQELNKRPGKGNRTKFKVVSDACPTDNKGMSRPLGPQFDHFDQPLVPSKVTGSTECTDLSLSSLEQRTQRPLQMLKDPAAAVRLKGLQITKVDR